MQFHLVRSTTAPAGNLAQFVRADLSYDIPAIKAVAKARYSLKLNFIESYTGTARRFWQWQQARRAIRETWQEARGQRHRIVWSRLPRELPYTREELDRRSVLQCRMAGASITARGNADRHAASGEYAQIVARAQRRAYDAILKAARAG